jgi:hypothetical protein
LQSGRSVVGLNRAERILIITPNLIETNPSKAEQLSHPPYIQYLVANKVQVLAPSVQTAQTLLLPEFRLYRFRARVPRVLPRTTLELLPSLRLDLVDLFVIPVPNFCIELATLHRHFLSGFWPDPMIRIGRGVIKNALRVWPVKLIL